MAPGWENGKTEDLQMHPALPKLAPRCGRSESMSVTLAPFLTRCQAQDDPTIPAPITTQWGLFFTCICELFHAVHVGNHSFQHGNSSIRCLLGAPEFTSRDQAGHFGIGGD